MHALGVGSIEYRSNGAILAAGVGGLQHEQQFLFAVGVQVLLQLLHSLVERLEDGFGVILGEPTVGVLIDALETSEVGRVNPVVVIGDRCH